jgi:uncharacterized ParB-like nuclease family protein
MNYSKVKILEERWEKSQAARPIQQVRSLGLRTLSLAPEVFQGRMAYVSGYLQEKHACDLAKSIKNTRIHLEPMTVFWIDGNYYIIDGHHRYEAYNRCQYNVPELMAKIPVDEFRGTFHEAKMLSATANTRNKLPMETIEKREMAWQLLNLGKDYYVNQVNITVITGVTKNTVTKYKKLMEDYLKEGFNPKDYTLKDALDNVRESVEYNEEWEDGQAEIKANLMRKFMGPIGRSHPEIMAKTLMIYLGEDIAERVVKKMAYDLSIKIEDDEFAAF